MNDTAESFELTPAGVETLPVVNNALSQIIAAAEHGVGVEELSKLMDMQERYEKNEARKAYFEALAASAIDMPVVTRDKINLQFDSKYSSKGNTINTIGPHLSKFGLSHRWSLDQSAGIAVTCVLSHTAGHSETVTIKGPPDTSGKKNELQQIKSTITYLEIMTFEAVTGTASQAGSMDDDGNTGVPVLTENEKAVRTKREPQDPITSEQIAQLKLHAERLRKAVDDGKPVKRILNQVVFYVDNTAKLTKRDTADILARLDSEA
jgi:hypothetical protein